MDSNSSFPDKIQDNDPFENPPSGKKSPSREMALCQPDCADCPYSAFTTGKLGEDNLIDLYPLDTFLNRGMLSVIIST
jgi:hypothetical protein